MATPSRSSRKLTALLLGTHKRLLGVLSGRLTIVLSTTLYAGLIAVLTQYIGAPGFPGYSTFEATPVGPSRLLFVYVLAVSPALWLPLSYRRPSQIVLWFMFYVAFIPSMIVPALTLGSPKPLFWLTVYGSLFLLRATYYLPLVDIDLQLSWQAYWGGLLVLWVAVTGSIVVTYWESFRLVGPQRTDELRSVYRAQLEQFGPVGRRLLEYGTSWLENVITPLFISSTLSRVVGPIWGVLGVAGATTVYLSGGFKSAPFAVFGTVGVYVLLHDGGRYFSTYASVLGTTVVGGVVVLHALSGGFLTVIGLVRRLVIIPGLVTGYHVEYFGGPGRPFTMFAERTWIGFPYPYSLPPSRLIGQEFFGDPTVAANAPFWGSGYHAAGLVGVLLMALLFALLVWLYDSFTVGLDRRFAGALLAGQLTGLAYTSLLSNIIIHGLGFLLVAGFLYPGVKEADSPKAP